MRLPSFAALALSLLSLALPARAEETRLLIAHTTDLHGSLTGWDYLADRAAPRGLVKLATTLDSLRATGVPLLLLDNGDTIEGAGIETVQHLQSVSDSDPMIAAMSKLGYDAMSLGNHEFDFGREVLEHARKQASFPMLAANIVNAADGSAAFTPSLVKVVGSVRVGIVGLCTPAVPQMTDPANVAGLRFSSPVEAAQREVTRLRTVEHCDVIVLLAHSGMERDTAEVAAALAANADYKAPTPDENWGYRLLTQVPGVDAVILGHTHTTLALVRGSVACGQAGKNGEALGIIDLALSRGAPTEAWRVTNRSASNLPVTLRLADQPALAAMAAPIHDATEQALAQPIANTTLALASPFGRAADSPVWDLVHRAQLEASGAEVSLAALYDADVRIAAGPVTLRQVLRIYPFDNTLVSVRLTGAQLRDVLEYSARQFAPYEFKFSRSLFTPGAAGYNFDAARGVTYAIDITQPAGSRIVNLQRNGQPLADGDSLTVVTNSYRAGGGGGFPWLAAAPRVWSTARRAHEVVADYLRKHAPLALNFEPGWRLSPNFVATPERPLIERLVKAGLVSQTEAAALDATTPATRVELACWLSRAFGWRSAKLTQAYAGVPDSLAPWLDGLLRRKALGATITFKTLQASQPVQLRTALDWSERVARSAGYSLRPVSDPAYRKSLLQRMKLADDATLTRAHVLGLIANLRYPELRILETTDFHGFILGGSKDRRSGRQLGGSAVLAAWITKLTAENPTGTVLIDGGDCFQGTMISNLQFGRPVVEQMNAIGYSAMAVGNHEFDWTADTLAARVRDMKFAALAANMIERKTHKLPRWARPDTVVSRAGVKIGILGMAYHYTPVVTLAKNVAHLTFEDDSATAARIVPQLQKRSDIVISVGHIPAETDSNRVARSGDLVRLAKGVPGVSAWFGGHSHNQVSDRVNGVPLMIAGAHGEVVAVCDLTVDPIANRVIDSRLDLVKTWADEVTPDSAMAARVTRWNATVSQIAGRKLGTLTTPLRRNRGGEGLVGDLVSDAMRAGSGADIALANSGGLRADMDAGDITRGSIYEVIPFDNTVFTMGLTAREVRMALEQALKFGRVTQVSGIRYRFDSKRPAMNRVLEVTDAQGAPLDSTKTFKVAVNDFMATGGDNYDVLSGGKDRQPTSLLVREVLESYVTALGAKGPLSLTLDGRIKREGGGDSGGGE